MNWSTVLPLPAVFVGILLVTAAELSMHSHNVISSVVAAYKADSMGVYSYDVVSSVLTAYKADSLTGVHTPLSQRQQTIKSLPSVQRHLVLLSAQNRCIQIWMTSQTAQSALANRRTFRLILLTMLE